MDSACLNSDRLKVVIKAANRPKVMIKAADRPKGRVPCDGHVRRVSLKSPN